VSFRSSSLTSPEQALAQAPPAAGLPPGVLTGIVVGVLLVVLLLVLLIGLVLRRRRRISLTETGGEVEPPRPSAGTYAAGGDFSFSSGGGPSTLERPPPPPAPQDGTTATTDGPATPSEVTDTAAPVVRPAPVEPTTVEPETAEPEAAAPEAAAPEAAAPEAAAPEAAAPEAAAPEAAAPEAPSAPAPTPPVAPPAPTPPEPAVAPASAVAPAPAEEIAPVEGRLERLRGRLGRSRSSLGQGLLGLLGAGDLDEDSWEEVEDTLLMADLGAGATQEIVATLRERIASRGVRTSVQVRDLLHEVLTEALRPEMERSVRALAHDGRPAVLLVAGVNGTGKTTTTGKLARVLVSQGHRVLLGAADTFRAAAAEQLATWGERTGAETVRGVDNADPASVAFEAVRRGTEAGVDAVLLDTAGRLHTKTGLMDELGKVKRVVSRQAEVDEVLLVLDATTGQNGLTQARVFREVVDVTGVVLTKLDGTAKGGIVFQVQRELGVPVKLVGLGEGPDDLAPFEPAAFVDALLR